MYRFYYGDLCPVQASDDWTEPVGVKGDKLYKSNDSAILPTTKSNGDVLQVVNLTWQAQGVLTSRKNSATIAEDGLKTRLTTAEAEKEVINGML